MSEGADVPGVKLASPGRSYDLGGTWCACDDPPTWEKEREALRVLSRSGDDYRLFLREFDRFRRRAEHGDLEYGHDRDVWRSGRAYLVLELRYGQRLEYPDGTRAVRLYFSEPDAIPDAMVAAKLAAKPATEAGLDLQDEHMDEAQLRILQFLGL